MKGGWVGGGREKRRRECKKMTAKKIEKDGGMRSEVGTGQKKRRSSAYQISPSWQSLDDFFQKHLIAECGDIMTDYLVRPVECFNPPTHCNYQPIVDVLITISARLEATSYGLSSLLHPK